MHVSKSSAALNPLTITPEKPEQNRSKIDIDISTSLHLFYAMYAQR